MVDRPAQRMVLLTVVGLVLVSFRNFRIVLMVELVRGREELPRNSTTTASMEAFKADRDVRVDFHRLWEEYQQWHSQESLEQDMLTDPYNITARKFAVGYYSCPLQAGNRLHHFFNSLIWAVVTNRTLLWKYYDEATCQRAGQKFSQAICRAANTEQDCATVLHRRVWLPSYHKWQTQLNLSDIKSLPMWSTTEPKKAKKKISGLVDTSPYQVVEFAPMVGQDARVLRNAQRRRHLLSTEAAQERARRLLGVGVDFLYGFLFHKTFSFVESIQNTIMVQWTLDNGNNQSDWTEYNTSHDNHSNNGPKNIIIVLHSRHSKRWDDGSNIQREQECLDQILDTTTRDGSKCTVLLLSDRPKTIQAVPWYLHHSHPHCRAIQAVRDQANVSFSYEHGPYAAAGFYQDLAVVKHMVANKHSSRAAHRIAVVGHQNRSSSQLIREIVTFRHDQQHDQHPTTSAADGILTCYYKETPSG